MTFPCQVVDTHMHVIPTGVDYQRRKFRKEVLNEPELLKYGFLKMAILIKLCLEIKSYLPDVIYAGKRTDVV